MRRARNVAFVIVFSLVLSVFGVSVCLRKLDAPVCDELGLDKTRSYLEGGKYARFPEPTFDAFVSTDFQTGLEDYVVDRFPLRDDVLLLNAAWQRALIRLSADVAGFDVYPTFYGSDYVYDSPRDEVVQVLEPASDSAVRQYEQAAEAYRGFASRHPELRLFFYAIDRASSSSNNPTHPLVGPSVDTEFLREHFFDLLGDGISVIDGSYPDEDSLAEGFFRTDHHWNGFAAYDAYTEILSAMLPEATPAAVERRVVLDEVPFFGSTARSGLCLTELPDYIEDCLVDDGGYEVLVGEKSSDSSALDHYGRYAAGEVGADPFTNRYAEYFHGDYGLIEIENRGAESGRSLLIVGDSFDNCVDRFFAANYAKVLVYDPRHATISVEELLSDHSVDDVLFLMGSTVFPIEENYAQLE